MASHSSCIKIINGQVIDPASGTNEIMDVFISDGKITQLDITNEQADSTDVIDAKGMIVCPGLVDICNRLREPGASSKGTIASETYAAVKGGVTSVCCPPDSSPVIDSTAIVKLIRFKAKTEGFNHVYMMAAMTKGLEGKQISEMKTLKDTGCIGVSNALKPIADTLVMKRIMQYAASHDIKIFITPQDYWLSKDTCSHEGAVSARLGLKGVSEHSETIALLRDLELIALTGVKAHFSHISSAKGIEIIRQAKRNGLDITADVSINHLHLTEMDLGFFSSDCHVTPPFRTQRDKEALIRAIKDNTIDAIISDHQPHDADAKLAPFAETETGISGVETFLSLTFKICEQFDIPLMQMLSKLSYEPAKILGIAAGKLAIDANADICIFDPKDYWTVDKQQFTSKGKNTPYHGWELPGRVISTLVSGKVVYTGNQ